MATSANVQFDWPAAGNTRAQFSLVNNSLHSPDTLPLLLLLGPLQLPDVIFNPKIATIHHQMTLHLYSCPSPFVPHPPPSSLSPTSSYPLLLINQNSLKIQSRPAANLSFCHLPSPLCCPSSSAALLPIKSAAVTPMVMKPGLDPNIFNSLRAISNLHSIQHTIHNVYYDENQLDPP